MKHYAKAAKEIAKIGDVVAWMCSRILSYASAKLCISLGVISALGSVFNDIDVDD